ncbi:hypothetical protein Q8F55_006321 [Vanrija albida]|uniref:Peptidase A1 domain-containing protein n=1 Tax=Vanrija albida TaxID=181172 RepID=A0ABR3PWU8_9TREE
MFNPHLGAAAALFAVSLLAEPSAAFLPRADDGPVNVDLFSNPQARLDSHVEVRQFARRRLALKYGFDDEVLKRQEGDYDLTNYVDARYNIKTAFGTPPQDFLLALDTGSTAIWVYDSSCSPTTCGNTTGGFDASRSSTYRPEPRVNRDMTYLTTYCKGPWGYDTVGFTNGLSGAERRNDSTDALLFMRCTDGNTTTHQLSHRGVLGMGWSVTKDTPYSLWMRLVSKWKDQRFGVFLAKQDADLGEDLSHSDQNGGVLTLGGVNTALFTGDINYIPLSNASYLNGVPYDWGVMLDRAEYGGKEFAVNTPAVVDTGGPTSLVPPEVYQAVYGDIPGAEAYTTPVPYVAFPCDTKLAPLTLTLGGVQYTIPGEELAIYIPKWDRPGRPKYCTNGLEPTPSGVRDWDWLLGDDFLRQVYSVYQYSPPAIGFAKLSDKAVSYAAGGNTAGSNTAGSNTTGTGAAAAGASGTAYPSAAASPTRTDSGAGSTVASLAGVVAGVVLAALA